MKTIQVLLIALLALSFTSMDNLPAVDRTEAKAAYLYLNKVRKDPKAFHKIFRAFDVRTPMPALRWNDTLAWVAEARALDMATHNYLAHVDSKGYGVNYYIQQAGYSLQPAWTKNPQANYFESCNGGGLSGVEAITMLINDDDVPTLDHRKHLLGMDNWSASLVDVGIGYVRSNSKSYYRTYTCVIIAKHK